MDPLPDREPKGKPMTDYPSRPAYMAQGANARPKLAPAEKVVPLRVAYTLLAICAALAISLIIALALLPAGSPPVPHCEEDEVLQAIDFPYSDADNLRCIHIDNL